ncbi:succinyl-CoA synthetase alpha subunit [Vibrio sp. ES.051]|uniref:acyl-CoA synthetase FdrA n=1 Tax=Vibrio sp. ES.051 TaxID=1761909 RepID=UPI000BF9E19F|nr:acyl-CoA synthetase FdrA [Vibrio sp. ES.051]PFG56278.1 succinyl-CoA synthetase alpha subunit [Vibrio sp. ES.051]
MVVKVIVKKNNYFDSVSLMALSTKVNELPDVEQAFVAMATDMNKGVLDNVGLLDDEIRTANSGDLFIVVKAASEEVCEQTLEEVEKLLKGGDKSSTGLGGAQEQKFTTLKSALKQQPDANLAIVSVPGEFAKREALIALNNDLHVLMFSDNVSVEDEIELKTLAHDKGLLMMGPDCGTAIINNVGLCFANKVRAGNIGIVGASGTGSQEVAARIHDFGGGITQLLGTGGRDLSEAVGGVMMLDGLRALEADPNTEIVLIVSKPAAKSVEAKVLEQVKSMSKPVVVCLLGGDEAPVVEAGAHFAKTTKEAALQSVILAGVDEAGINKRALNLPLIEEIKAKLAPEQKYIRGLFCGGTLCEESMMLAREHFSDVYSNIAKKPEQRLADIDVSQAHTFIDFGDDDFTNGRPHPMIDPSSRIDRLLKEADDPEVGVILLDFVIGYGSHQDPVGVTLPAIIEAKQKAAERGQHLEILGYVLGTDLDTPDMSEQIEKLAQAGVTISSSSQNTGLLARGFVSKGE